MRRKDGVSAVMTEGRTWWWTLVILVATPVVGVLAHSLASKLIGRLASRTPGTIDDSLVRHARGPTSVLVPLLALLFVIPYAGLTVGAASLLQHGISLALIAVTGWLIIAMFSVVDDVLVARYPINVDDNLRARRVVTQIGVLRRIAIVVVTIVTAAVILMTFPTVRSIGDSLLASAGVAGLVVGLAARPTLSSLIAGVQLALTEPIRLEDVVVVEGEWGRIEEIRTTFVVIRIWDQRRLVVPLSYFIEKPFQNWTRSTSDLIGSVFVFTDYRVPVDAIRSEVKRIVHGTELWNGKVMNVQVTDATESTIQIRVLVSASDSSKVWDLRCLVREQLVGYLQQHHPESLPRVRSESVVLPNPGEVAAITTGQPVSPGAAASASSSPPAV